MSVFSSLSYIALLNNALFNVIAISKALQERPIWQSTIELSYTSIIGAIKKNLSSPAI
nr:hypothetical protein [Thermovenabulum gondwanense]